MQVHVREQRRNHRALRSPLSRLRPFPIFEYAGPQPFLDQAKDPSIPDSMLEKLNHPFVRERPIAVTNVSIQHPIHFLPHDPHPQRVQRIVRAAFRSETIGEAQEVLLVDLIEDSPHRVLNDFVLQGSYAQWSLSSIRFCGCRRSWKGALARYPGARDCANPPAVCPGPFPIPATSTRPLPVQLPASGPRSCP